MLTDDVLALGTSMVIDDHRDFWLHPNGLVYFTPRVREIRGGQRGESRINRDTPYGQSVLTIRL